LEKIGVKLPGLTRKQAGYPGVPPDGPDKPEHDRCQGAVQKQIPIIRRNSNMIEAGPGSVPLKAIEDCKLRICKWPRPDGVLAQPAPDGRIAGCWPPVRMARHGGRSRARSSGTVPHHQSHHLLKIPADGHDIFLIIN
jgi:hypothetical protein